MPAAARTILADAAKITDEEFDRLRGLIYDTFGVSLSDAKRSLVTGRLNAVLQREGLTSFQAYYERVKADASGTLLSELVNRISTNHTFFYREPVHFDFYRTRILPEAMNRATAAGSKDLRIWCAASSYGQEPYTLALLQREVLGLRYSDWKAGLLATDINDQVLSAARTGIYEAEDAQALPDLLRTKYLDRLADGRYQVKELVRREVTFRRFNLMNRVFPFKAPFDAIFCRNVMIYFDNETKRDLAKRMYRVTSPGGYLIIGSSEALPREQCPYVQVAPGVYRRT